MSELLLEIVGWFGYLERSEVRVQVILLLLVFLGQSALRRRLAPRLPLAGRPAVLIPSLLGLLSLALGLAGQPYGLLLLGLLLYLGWLGLEAVRLLLGRFIQPQQMQLLETRLIRPAYLLISALLVIRVFDNPQDLALIPIGEWFGSEVTLGSFFLAVLIVYVLAMGT